MNRATPLKNKIEAIAAQVPHLAVQPDCDQGPRVIQMLLDVGEEVGEMEAPEELPHDRPKTVIAHFPWAMAIGISIGMVAWLMCWAR